MTPFKTLLAVTAVFFLAACEDKMAKSHGDAMHDANAMAGEAGAMADDTMSEDTMMSN